MALPALPAAASAAFVLLDLLLPLLLLRFGFGFDFGCGCGYGDSDGCDFGNSASPVGNERVCVPVVRVKHVCDEVENMLHVQPNELRSLLRKQRHQQRICRKAALLLLCCNVTHNCCASFN